MSIIIKGGSSSNLADVTAALALKVDGSAVTQPVSISGSVPVSGSVSVSNFPATQPVSGTVAVSNFPATQPVSAASLPLPSGAATSANQVTEISSLASIDTKTASLGQTTMSASSPVVIASNQSNVPTTQVGGASGLVGDVQAKGVQGVNGLMTQDFKDSGRVMKVFTATFTPTAAEAMATLTPVTDGVAGTPGTSFTVTAGKRFRLQHISASLFNTTAAIRSLIANLRMTASGAVIVTSPQIATLGVPSTAAATASLTQGNVLNFPDGLEFSGTMQFGISQQGIALAGADVAVVGYEY